MPFGNGFDEDDPTGEYAKRGRGTEQQRLTCPQCGREVGNLPLHLRAGWCGDE